MKQWNLVGNYTVSSLSLLSIVNFISRVVQSAFACRGYIRAKEFGRVGSIYDCVFEMTTFHSGWIGIATGIASEFRLWDKKRSWWSVVFKRERERERDLWRNRRVIGQRELVDCTARFHLQLCIWMAPVGWNGKCKPMEVHLARVTSFERISPKELDQKVQGRWTLKRTR